MCSSKISAPARWTGWALAATAARALNPRLIYAAITGFGPDGPYRNIRVYDPVVQAVSGLAATQVDREGTARRWCAT